MDNLNDVYNRNNSKDKNRDNRTNRDKNRDNRTNRDKNRDNNSDNRTNIDDIDNESSDYDIDNDVSNLEEFGKDIDFSSCCIGSIDEKKEHFMDDIVD